MRNARLWLTELASLLCMVAAAWPLETLVTGHALLTPALVMVLVLWAVGVMCRRLHLSAGLGLIAQGAVAVAGLAVYAASRGVTLSPSGLRALVTATEKTIRDAVAPLPAETGVLLMFLLGACLLAVVVDFVGASSRIPLLAALPMTAPFVLAAVALGTKLPVQYFVYAACAWVFLVWALHQPTHGTSMASGRSLAFVAGTTAVAVVTALLFASHTPHRATPVLAQNARSGIDDSVDFSESLDLAKSLKSKNGAPVLIYSTDADTPAPLRVTTSSLYRDGRWEATTSRQATTTAKAQSALTIPGYSPSVPATLQRVSVTVNGMKNPLVAAPAPLEVANFGAGNQTFRVTKDSGVPLLSTKPAAYSVLYRTFTAAARPTSDADSRRAASVTADDTDLGGLPSDAQDRVRQLTQKITADATSKFDAAVAIQRSFRTDPSYTYSLDLAPTQQVKGKDLDPLSNFLVTKRGYCTQYATAMIMMARSKGIPARMAVGFLPGTPTSDGNGWAVRAADAHAWPELYFPGMGWVRFDPTPGSRSGDAPPYAPDEAKSSASASPSTSTSSSTAPTSTQSSPPPSTSTEPSTSTQPTAAPKHDDSFPWGTVLTVMGVLLLLGLAALVVPLAGRWERGRLLAAAKNDRQRDEGHWHAMRWHLADLGLDVPTGRSPRQIAEAFTNDHPDVSPQLSDALARAVAALEGSRYAPSAPSVEKAVGRVTRAADESATRGARLKALLWPASGLAGLRRLFLRG